VRGWPFAVLLELAAREEAAVRAALADALAAQGWRRRERDAAADALRSHRTSENEVVRRPGAPAPSAASLRGTALHLSRLRTERERLAEALGARDVALAAAARTVASTRDALAAARTAVAVLERHRDAWRAERARARAAAEDAAAEDLVSAARRAAR